MNTKKDEPREFKGFKTVFNPGTLKYQPITRINEDTKKQPVFIPIGQDYSNGGIFTNFKHWLIKFIAGDATVLLNVDLTFEVRKYKRVPIVMPVMDDGLFHTFNVNLPDDKQLRIGKWKG